jgi:hypothetical protein
MIIGMGEVGRALSAYLNMPGRDIEPEGEQADTIHIAYPWTPDFEEQVWTHADEHNASLVIVHSTVPVGTCDPHGWVHSPVRGQHPISFEATTKTFGGALGFLAAAEWPGPVRVYPTARLTEAGKLFELAQYGLQVRVMQSIHEWCRTQNLDFAAVYSEFAEDYNRDYSKLGEDRFIRPILEYMGEGIGGHCVLPSMGLLDHPIARLVEHDLQ